MKGVVAIFVTLCLTHLQNINGDVKVLHKLIVTNDSRTLAFGFESHTDEHLTYALYDKKHPEIEETKCTVFREKEPYGNDTYSCDVTLKSPHGLEPPKKFPHVSVYPFGQKYAALVAREGRGHMNFTVVQMDSCKASEAGIPYVDSLSSIGWMHLAILGHNDSFDVFFNDANLCVDKTCKATIGADGKVINEPKPLIKKLVRSDFVPSPIVAINNGSSRNGYFYVAQDGNDYVHLLVKPDGTEKSLARHPKPTGFLGISTKNNILGVCYQMYKKFECSQYDFDGNLKHRITITNEDKILVYFAIFNLPNGGFYAFSAECEGKSIEYCHDYPRFFIERFDANGTKNKPIIFQGFGKSFGKELSPLVYENDDKEVCFSLAATRVRQQVDQSELTANCFTDADFNI